MIRGMSTPSPLDAGWARTILASISEGVVVQGADGTIIDANPAAEQLLGLTLDQLAGRTSMDPRWAAIHEDGSPFPGDTHPAMDTLRTGAPLRGVVMGVLLPGGGDRWIAIDTIVLATGPDGRPLAVAAIFRELADERRGPLAEQRSRWFAGRASDLMLTADAATMRFTWISPSVTRIRGFTVAEALAQDLDDALTPASAALLREHLARVLADEPAAGEPVPGHREVLLELEQTCKDGSTRIIETVFTPVADEEGRFTTILGVGRDVTDRVVAERDREQTLVELREALARVRTLSGLLPICMYCKKVRTDEGYWDRIESYIAEHTDARPSHGMCPDCYRIHVPPELQVDSADGMTAGDGRPGAMPPPPD
jgi:PAS domain S-box-containing protein